MNISNISGGICAPKGFKAGGLHCGIRNNQTKKDLGLIVSDVLANAAAVYTQNKVFGAPIKVTRDNLTDGKAQAMVCNSGIANTCAADGIFTATSMCEYVEQYSDIPKNNVIVASTGVIGVSLPLDKIKVGLEKLSTQLSYDGGNDFAQSIMTTDTFDKQIAIEFEIDGKVCRIGGTAKGSGMINPNMATMLSFITTDVAICSEMLNSALTDVVNDTFNMLSVDGDTSTNDTLSIMANGMAENICIISKDDNYNIFKNALMNVCVSLTKMLAKDGEGATKMLTCNVFGAPDKSAAKAIGKSVISSSLVKAAMFGKDANWGRILCALGYADAEFDINLVDVALSSSAGSIDVCKNGAGIPFDEDIALKVLEPDEIVFEINLNQGNEKATAWGCDLTYDYVKINGDYRS